MKRIQLFQMVLFVAVTLCVSLSLFTGQFFSTPKAHAITTAEYCIEKEEQLFLGLINDYRASNGLGPLSASQTLGAASEHHSLDMAINNYFSHTLFDGTTWSQNTINHGYINTGGYRGENIAGGYMSASSVMSAWKASSGHNANMLKPTFTTIGIGRAYGASSDWKWYWTTDFGGLFDTPAIPCGATITPSPTSIPTPTRTPTPTLTPTRTPTPPPGVTITITPSPTSIPTPTRTPTPTLTPTPTRIPTPTSAPVPTPVDTTPPVVTITNPQDNAVLARRSKVTITATAFDNVKVTRVDFLVGGSLKCSSMLAPYSCIWKIPASANRSYTIDARAYDAAGNNALSTIQITTQ